MGFEDDDLGQLFVSIGPGLEHFDLYCGHEPRFAQCLAYVKKYCCNLRSLAITSDKNSLPRDLTELVSSY